MDIAKGNFSVADFFFEEYCPWVWYGDSISANLYKAFIKAFKPDHLSGMGSSMTDNNLVGLGSLVPSDGGVVQNLYEEKVGNASITGQHYATLAIPEVSLTAGVTHSTPAHGVDQRIMEGLVGYENNWKVRSPFPTLTKQAGTWRIIYLQHAESPQSMRVWDSKPRTDYLDAAAITKFETVDFRGDGTVKLTYQDFAVPAVTTNYDATKYRRLGIFAPTGVYPSNDKLAIREVEYILDRTGNIPHQSAVGGFTLGDLLNVNYANNDIALRQYLQCIDCKLVMLMIGFNGYDSAGYTRSEFPEKLRTFMAKCSEANSNMKFILWGYPYFFQTGSASLGLTTRKAHNEAIAEAAGTSALYCDLGEALGDPELVNSMTADQVHPSNDSTNPVGFGAYEISRAMIQCLQYARGKTAVSMGTKTTNVLIGGLKPNTFYLIEKVSPPTRGEPAIIAKTSDSNGNLPETILSRNSKYSVRQRNLPAVKTISTGKDGRLIA